MRRQENQPPRPTAGCLPVPLFNQRKRPRVPLTSAPSENEFFSHSEYMTSSNTPGAYGCNQASGRSSQSQLWCRQGSQGPTLPQQYGSSRPAPGPSPAMSHYAPIPHPYRADGTGSKMGQFIKPHRKQEPSPSPSGNSGQGQDPVPRVPHNKYSKPTPHTAVSHMSQQSIYKPQNPTHQYSQQSRPVPAPVPPASRPSACAPQPQSKSWNFTSSFGPQKSPSEGNKNNNPPQRVQQAPSQQETSPAKPAFENSLRIITAVIDGMRHWSQFRDKIPYLFEIFATLDSAVTLGCHGAKNFLMRSGKEVVQCVFYENEQDLPRLIRGQVHRCVGNYDRSRDVLTCVSVRPGLPSELRNAQEAVKACDAEMRSLVKSFSEV